MMSWRYVCKLNSAFYLFTDAMENQKGLPFKVWGHWKYRKSWWAIGNELSLNYPTGRFILKWRDRVLDEIKMYFLEYKFRN